MVFIKKKAVYGSIKHAPVKVRKNLNEPEAVQPRSVCINFR